MVDFAKDKLVDLVNNAFIEKNPESFITLISITLASFTVTAYTAGILFGLAKAVTKGVIKRITFQPGNLYKEITTYMDNHKPEWKEPCADGGILDYNVFNIQIGVNNNCIWKIRLTSDNTDIKDKFNVSEIKRLTTKVLSTRDNLIKERNLAAQEKLLRRIQKLNKKEEKLVQTSDTKECVSPAEKAALEVEASKKETQNKDVDVKKLAEEISKIILATQINPCIYPVSGVAYVPPQMDPSPTILKMSQHINNPSKDKGKGA